jgi:hypothetical protein
MYSELRQIRRARWSLAALAAAGSLGLAGCNDGGSDFVVDIGDGTAVSTADVLCDISGNEFNDDESVNLTATYSWTCGATTRVLTANGVPNHEVGTFPNVDNPNTIGATTVSAAYTLLPALSNATTSVKIPGFALNGVKFDPGTAGTCNDAGDNCDLGQGGTGSWRIEALGQSSFNFGTDANNAHVQPTGEYHYHGMPELYISKLGGGAQMTLIGWSNDGFPIYARLGYNAPNDATSELVELIGSYQIKTAPDAGRPDTDIYPMGAFMQDYEYVAGSGDLDECNGRFGVTPEFPDGIYYYMITDTYPFIQRCVKGTSTEAGGGGPPPPPAG